MRLKKSIKPLLNTCNKIEQPYYSFILWSFLILGLFLRFHLYAKRGFWCDEIEHIVNLKRSFFEVFVTYMHNIPGGLPGDYFLTYPIGHFTDAKWLIVIPHIITTLFTFYFFVRIGEKLLGRSTAFLIALLCFSLNQWHIFHSLEIRPYGPLTMIGLLYFWLIDKYMTEWVISSHTIWKSLVVGLATWLTAFFHAYGPLIIFIISLYFLITDRNLNLKQLNKLLYRFMPVFLGFLLAVPVFLFFFRPQNIILDTFSFISKPPFKLTKTVVALLTGSRIMYPLLIFIPLSYLPFCKGRRERSIFLALMVIFPLLAILFSDIIGQYYFVQRQFVWIMPFWAFFIGWCYKDFIKAVLNGK